MRRSPSLPSAILHPPGVSAGRRLMRFPPARARSCPSLIRSLAESTWWAPWAMERRKNLGAALAGVDVLPDDHDADVAPGKLHLDAHALLEVPAEAVKKGDDYGVAGLGPGHELLPGRPIRQATAPTRSPAWN